MTTEIGKDEKPVPFTVDALAWAKEFVTTLTQNKLNAADVDWMHTWFASAIMAGYDTANERMQGAIIKGEAECGYKLHPFTPIIFIRGNKASEKQRNPMPHYMNGRVAQEGDPVVLKDYNQRVAVGTVYNISPGLNSCNCSVATLIPGGVSPLTCQSTANLLHAEDALQAFLNTTAKAEAAPPPPPQPGNTPGTPA